jgi:nitric oxide reductase large subunit
MFKIIILHLLLAVLPLFSYIIYLYLRYQNININRFNKKTTYILIVSGLLSAITLFYTTALMYGSDASSTYTPPYIINGTIVSGEVNEFNN